MWSFSTLKDKRYWILLIPASIIWFLFAFFIPKHILEKTYILAILPIIFMTLFWSTYHIWKYFGDRNKLNNNHDSCDL